MELKMKKIESYADTAIVWSKRSTCTRKQVGAVIFDTDSDRLLAIGYNGTVSGLVHCNELFEYHSDINKFYIHGKVNDFLDNTEIDNDCFWHSVNERKFKELHHIFSEQYEVHSEQNALLNMVHTGTKKSSNMGIVCTLEPCLNCAKLIIGAGIKHVWYMEKYDRATYDIKQYFERAGVTCEEFIWQ